MYRKPCHMLFRKLIPSFTLTDFQRGEFFQIVHSICELTFCPVLRLFSPGWMKTCLCSVISSLWLFFYTPRFITFAEPALSLSSVKEPSWKLTHEREQTCALLIKLSRKEKASKLTREEKTTSIIFQLLE